MKSLKKAKPRNQKGDETMAVSAKPKTGPFIVEAANKDLFFSSNNNKASKAIERFMERKPKEGIVNPYKK